MLFLLRFLLVFIVVGLLLRMLRLLLFPVRTGPVRRAGGPPPPPPGGATERLVQDPVCGVRLPESRAIRDGDRYYCSAECRARDTG